MKSVIEPYLFFQGRCEEALQFYQKALGAEVQMIMRYKECPEAPPPGMIPANWGDKIMHSSFKVGSNIVMASDGCGEAGKFEGFSLSIAVNTEAEAKKIFAALSEGGKVEMPLTKTFWSPCFGMLEDKFGVGWMISVTPTMQPFVISGTFDAPREKVWEAWTELGQLEHWFGPKGIKTTAIKREFKPGGLFHYKMTTPDGKEMWGRQIYREISALHKLVWVNSFSDEHAGVARHPMAATWPLELLTTVAFSGNGEKTTVTLEWMPINASEAELKMFDGAREGMKGGWSGSFDQLTEYLAKK